MRKCGLLAVILFMMCWHSSTAQMPSSSSGASPETPEYNVLGVKLGMSAKEVIETLKVRLPGSEVSAEVDHDHYTIGGTHTVHVYAKSPQGHVAVYFVESFPVDKARLEQATEITYTIAYTTPADLQVIYNAVSAKYGTLIHNRPDDAHRWCSPTQTLYPGAKFEGCMPHAPNLAFFHDTIILSDNHATEDATKDAWKKNKTIAPPPM